VSVKERTLFLIFDIVDIIMLSVC